MFENSKNYFEQRLQPSGFNEKLNYTEENSKINSRSQKHNILWFNPPYSKLDKIDIGQFVLHLVNKDFQEKHVCPTPNQKLVHITKKKKNR